MNDKWIDECAAVLMHRWGVEDTDEDGYDAAVADVEALLRAGLIQRSGQTAHDNDAILTPMNDAILTPMNGTAAGDQATERKMAVEYQRYTDRLAQERMSVGLCPECGCEVNAHGGLGGSRCSLTDNGVTSRIWQFEQDGGGQSDVG